MSTNVTDIDECVTEKPCDQLCRNLPGIYECYCRPGFQLQKDGQSCRKNGELKKFYSSKDEFVFEISIVTNKSIQKKKNYQFWKYLNAVHEILLYTLVTPMNKFFNSFLLFCSILVFRILEGKNHTIFIEETIIFRCIYSH